MDGLRMSEVAKQSEVNLETIRYYERQGLLPKGREDVRGLHGSPATGVSGLRGHPGRRQEGDEALP